MEDGGVQDRIYRLLEELQKMATELPSSLQQRLPNELLSGLASSIASGMIYEIIQGLTDIQQGTEKHLFHQRLEMLKKQSDEKVEFKARYRETLAKIASSTNGEDQEANNKEGGPDIIQKTKLSLDHEEEEMLLKHAEETKDFDVNVVLSLDQKVSDQQQTLESAGVPGFYVTNKPDDIKLQMHLLDLIQRLEEKEKSGLIT